MDKRKLAAQMAEIIAEVRKGIERAEAIAPLVGRTHLARLAGMVGERKQPPDEAH